jgi:hypothetical protein
MSQSKTTTNRHVSRIPVIWHYLPEAPDEEISVLVAYEDDVTEGYLSEGKWCYQNTDWREIPGVYAWADLPPPPPQ